MVQGLTTGPAAPDQGPPCLFLLFLHCALSRGPSYPGRVIPHGFSLPRGGWGPITEKGSTHHWEVPLLLKSL